MRPMSLNEWYRYLETQFIEEQSTPESAKAEPPKEAEPTHAEPPRMEAPPTEAVVQVCLEPPAPSVSALVEPEVPSPSQPLNAEGMPPSAVQVSIRVPHLLEFLPIWQEEQGMPSPTAQRHTATTQEEPPSDGPRLHKRRRRRKKVDPDLVVPPEADEVWAKLPRYLRYLAEWTDDSVTRKYYPARIRESREELIARLTDPVLTLEEVARLLGVCPATIRRYTDRGWLRHFRTEGNQRRFRLSDIVAFLEEQALRRPTGNRGANQALPEENRHTP